MRVEGAPGFSFLEASWVGWWACRWRHAPRGGGFVALYLHYPGGRVCFNDVVKRWPLFPASQRVCFGNLVKQ